jgi:VanZ family protein
MTAHLDRLVQWLSYAAVLGIIVLSLVPGNARPHTGAPGQGEHTIAYLLTAFLFGLRSASWPQLLRAGIFLLACAGILEIAQLWVSGRNSQIGDFVASSIGILIGMAGGRALNPFYKRLVLARLAGKTK